ncbi:hypothetical protein KM043_001829 [Ampulex compressa]|nr:hypothetical protein KM043_001829 [Ampulex compressa]
MAPKVPVSVALEGEKRSNFTRRKRKSRPKEGAEREEKESVVRGEGGEKWRSESAEWRVRETAPFVYRVATPSLSTSLYAEVICLIAVITGSTGGDGPEGVPGGGIGGGGEARLPGVQGARYVTCGRTRPTERSRTQPEAQRGAEDDKA